MPTSDRLEDVSFSYFVVRLRRDGAAVAPDLSGVVERIGSGDKHAFTTGTELVELLGLLAQSPAPPMAGNTPVETG